MWISLSFASQSPSCARDHIEPSSSPLRHVMESYPETPSSLLPREKCVISMAWFSEKPITDQLRDNCAETFGIRKSLFALIILQGGIHFSVVTRASSRQSWRLVRKPHFTIPAGSSHPFASSPLGAYPPAPFAFRHLCRKVCQAYLSAG